MSLSFPRTAVYVILTDEMFNATEVDKSNGIYQATVSLPANMTNTDIVYDMEVYCNEMPMGVKTSVTVKATEDPDAYYTVTSIEPDSNHIDHDHGSVNVKITFKL